jgi:transposase
MKKSITFVGLDVHKNSIAVAIADAGRNAEVRNYGIIGGTLGDLDRLVKKLSAPDKKLHFVYEAGPCGYEIFRSLTLRGLECAVCSPAHIPKSPADRIKTDRRDAMMLARLHRAGKPSRVRLEFRTFRAICLHDVTCNPLCSYSKRRHSNFARSVNLM